MKQIEVTISITILIFFFVHFASSRHVRVVDISNQPSANQDIVKVVGTVPETSFITQPAVITTSITNLPNNDQQVKEADRASPVYQAQTVVTQQNVACVPQHDQTTNPQQNSPVCTQTTQTQAKNAASITTSDSVQTNSAKETEASENEAKTSQHQQEVTNDSQQTVKEDSEWKEEVKVEPLRKEKDKQDESTKKEAAKEKQGTQVEETNTEKQETETETVKQEPKTEKQETKTEKQETETEKQETETEKQETKTEKQETKTEKQEEQVVTVEEKKEESSKVAKQEEKKTEKVNIDSLLSKVSGREICNSPHCIEVARTIMASLNKSADPCDNYYEYACGSWVKEHKIPKFHSQYSRISELSENNEKVLMSSLKTDQVTDNDTLRKVKMFYRSCMDRNSIEKEGIAPLKHYVEELGSWNIDKSWESKDWNFYKTLTKMHGQYPAEVFFTVDVHTDPAARDHANAEFIILIIRLVSTYMAHIINMAGCPEKTADDKVRDIMKFETKLATISVPKIAKKYVRIDVGKLSKAIPEFPWMDHLQGIFWQQNITNETKVIVLANDYLPNLFELVRKEDKSTLSNYMVWRLVKDVVPLLPKRFRREHFQLKKKLLGVKSDKPRERKCFGYANNLLGPLMGALFVRNAFSPESKHKVEVMMEGIIKSFKDNIEHVDWVDKDTVAAVETKADSAVYKVGYPDYLWDEKKFSKRYSMLNISNGHWFDNVLETDKFASLQTFKKLNTVSDKHQWITTPHLVNAFYVITKNEIVIPAGILQPPFFYPEEIPRSISYGAIGHVLGHELTHGFDTTGRKYDKNGEEIDPSNHTNTWSNSSIKAFEKRAKCLVEQFSNYKILGKFHIDGLKTLGENIADGGGVKLAFRAFRDFLETHQDEKILPNLNMPHEELFFLGYAQKECVRTSAAAEFLAVMEDVHPLSKYRVIGTLSNMDEFSDVYKCKKGSKMNPEKKCEVW